jgi:hypothetical protein
MAWYEVDLSDGTKQKLWFGHDPTEDEVNERLAGPKIGAAPAGEAERMAAADEKRIAEEPSGERGVTPLTRLLGTEADPNSPEVLLKGALFAGSGIMGEGTAPVAAKGAATMGQRLMALARRPPVAGAAVGGGAGYLEGGPKGAAYGAAAGAGLPIGAKHIVGKMAGNVIRQAVAEEAAAAASVAGRTAGAEAPAVTQAARNAALFAASQETAATQAAARAAAHAAAQAAEMEAPAAASIGAQRAAQHQAQVAFAKDAVGAGRVKGEKVWMLLDEQGLPVRVLTPDQAGAAARSGQTTTWIRNLWR